MNCESKSFNFLVKSQSLAFSYSHYEMLQIGSWRLGAIQERPQPRQNGRKGFICSLIYPCSLGISRTHQSMSLKEKTLRVSESKVRTPWQASIDGLKLLIYSLLTTCLFRNALGGVMLNWGSLSYKLEPKVFF